MKDRQWRAAAAAIVTTLTISACATGGSSGDDAGPTAPPAAPTSPGESGPTEQTTPQGLEPSEGFAVAEIALRDEEDEIPMEVFVADEAPLRQDGLMHREYLPPDAGMLFVFEETRRGGFWMKNTLIPLSIAFAEDDGTIVAVLDMEPCTEDPCPTYDPNVPYRYALEANQGFFDERGITPGWTIDVSAAQGEGGRGTADDGGRDT